MRPITDSRPIRPVTGKFKNIEPVHVNQEILQRVTGLIQFGVSMLNILIGMRVLLHLLGASPFHPFAMLVYSTSEPFLSVFQGLTRSHLFRGVTLEVNALVAIIVYSLFGWAAIRLIRIMFADPN